MASSTGLVGLIHLESHFTDEKAGLLRSETYRRLRRHWQFINELKLFEIQDQKRFGINVYGSNRDPQFMQAASLYHPDTVIRSLKHDGSGAEPGIKDLDGNWDVRPHASRIVNVTAETLRSWHAVLETEGVPANQTRMVYAVNKSTAAVLDKLSRAPRVGELGLEFSRGWDESIDRKKGFFDSEWGVPESWDSVILQGSHLGVGRPLFKYPNPTMLNHLDWTETDLEHLEPNAIPATSFKPCTEPAKYDAAYTHWGSGTDEKLIAARDHFRLAWRNMAANSGERTLIPGLIPPRAAHVDGIYSLGVPGDNDTLVRLAASMCSLISDFAVRVAPKSTIRSGTASRLPRGFNDLTGTALALRVLRLNCITDAYAELWADCFDSMFLTDTWTNSAFGLLSDEIGKVTTSWTPAIPLRRAVERRQALVEIDALVALSVGVTADELCTIYRTQFPVLYGYDTRSIFYDANGRTVPSAILALWRRRGMNLSDCEDQEFSATHPGSDRTYRYETPFISLDREKDMRVAYATFVQRLKLDS